MFDHLQATTFPIGYQLGESGRQRVAHTLIGSLSTRRFWATDGNQKRAVFSVNLSCLHTITFTPLIAKYLFTRENDYFENLSETTDLPSEMFISGLRPQYAKYDTWDVHEVQKFHLFQQGTTTNHL